MQVKDRAIVIQCIKYADKKHIVKLFTENHGIVTCHARLSNTPTSKIKTSVVMPLNLIEVEMVSKENKDIQLLTEANSFYIYTSIHHDFKKLSIFHFLNEVLNKTLKEQISQIELFDFLKTSLVYFNETTESVSQFHHYFLLELLKHFGINPINNYDATASFFNCREAQFTPIELPFPMGLNQICSELLSKALNADLLSKKMNHEQRAMLLDAILAYYKLHVPGFNDLKSLSVLKEIALS
jgi:DNA repair protein RecO (recombination protein O)